MDLRIGKASRVKWVVQLYADVGLGISITKTHHLAKQQLPVT
jgi:hypothetical protein